MTAITTNSKRKNQRPTNNKVVETKTKHAFHQNKNNSDHNKKKNNKNVVAAPKTTSASTSTRVCIKNLPPSFTSFQLRDFLQTEYKKRSDGSHNNGDEDSKLVVTDCRVLMHPVKKLSRRMAFCGFQTTEMAQRVIDLFDQSFALTSRLSVEPAYAAAVATKQEDNNHKNDANENQRKNKDKNDLSNKQHDKDSKKKEKTSNVAKELLEIGNSKAKFWSNDFNITTEDTRAKKDSKNDNKKDDDISNNNKNDDASDDGSEGGASSTSSDHSDSSEDDADPLLVSSKSKPSQMSDMDFLKSKQKMVDDLGDDPEENNKEGENEDDEDEILNMPQEEATESSSDSSDSDGESSQHSTSADHNNTTSHSSEGINKNHDNSDQKRGDEEDLKKHDSEEEEEVHSPRVASNRLFVRNLPFATTEEELEEHFSTFGSVSECHIPVDDRKMSKGFAFVTFSNGQDATRALEELDGTDFQGRFLHILHSRQKPQDDSGAGNDDSNNNDRPLSYKERQELARRQEATKSSTGWSASFVRGDTVVDSLADRLGIKKGDILNVKGGLSSGDAAVRLALGETQIIEENREYFQDHGIDMEALVSAKPAAADNKGAVKRSKTSLLVKNLPYDTLVEELEKVFHGVGDAPKKILLPPSRTIALVEYSHSSEAKRAFRKLAYRRFKSVPLYLEWAPLAASIDQSKDTANATEPTPSSKQVVGDSKEDEEGEAVLDGPTPSIYIKNLNFSTTEEKLQQVFEKAVGDVRAVKIPKKLAPLKKRAGSDDHDDSQMQSLSMGFGFVEFASHDAARRALTKLQGTLVDGHALELKPSNKSLTNEDAKLRPVPSAKKNLTKVVVRNVPFQASRTEILKLFGSFGQLKRVRLPKKFDGGHRGFAFVDFVTHKEAIAAMKSLSRTHLYGRHLVLEWAEDVTEDPELGLDALREKAQRDVSDGEVNKSKRQRVS